MSQLKIKHWDKHIDRIKGWHIDLFRELDARSNVDINIDGLVFSPPTKPSDFNAFDTLDEALDAAIDKPDRIFATFCRLVVPLEDIQSLVVECDNMGMDVEFSVTGQLTIALRVSLKTNISLFDPELNVINSEISVVYAVVDNNKLFNFFSSSKPMIFTSQERALDKASELSMMLGVHEENRHKNKQYGIHILAEGEQCTDANLNFVAMHGNIYYRKSPFTNKFSETAEFIKWYNHLERAFTSSE